MMIDWGAIVTVSSIQSLLIFVLCLASVYYMISGMKFIAGAPWLKTLQFLEAFVMLYIGGLYFLSFIKAATGFDLGVTMIYYRPGILLLVITIFAQKLWRHRAGIR